MNVEELLADPIAACGLPAGSIPAHAVVLIEYYRPSAVEVPNRARIAMQADDDCGCWTSIGMLRFALQKELDSVDDMEDDQD